MSKYIFFDIDGTIHDNDIGVVDDAKKTINTLKANGNKVFICTGRSKSTIGDYILDIGFDGIVAACGLYISIDGKLIENKVIEDDVLEIIKNTLVGKKGCYPIFEGSDYFYEDYSILSEKELKKRENFIKLNSVNKRNFTDKIFNINKLSLKLYNTDMFEEIKEKLKDYFYILDYGHSMYEIIPKGYDKGVGMKKVLDYYGADLKDSIAVGDGINDIPMLKLADISILVGGCEEAKPYANYVTDSVLENGISKVFRKLEMI